jgi:dGTP triphosphohydrolase
VLNCQKHQFCKMDVLQNILNDVSDLLDIPLCSIQSKLQVKDVVFAHSMVYSAIYSLEYFKKYDHEKAKIINRALKICRRHIKDVSVELIVDQYNTARQAFVDAYAKTKNLIFSGWIDDENIGFFDNQTSKNIKKSFKDVKNFVVNRNFNVN